MRRLRRRRLIPAKYRGLASIIGAVLMLGGVYFVFTYIIGGGLLQGSISPSATAEAAPAAASQAGPDGAASPAADPISPMATPTPPPAVAVARGQLALVREGDAPILLACEQYRVLRGNELLGFGSTDAAGVALAIPKRRVVVFCDGMRSEY
jgi:hypothetical protein